MDVVATTKRSAAIVGAVAVLLLLVLLAWIGGEAHYRNCLARVDLQHPIAAQADSAAAVQGREEGIDDCSRLP